MNKSDMQTLWEVWCDAYGIRPATEPKFDVLIFDVATGQVVAIADFCLPDLEARKLAYRLNDGNLHIHLAADAFGANSVAVGGFVTVDEATLDRLLSESPGTKSPTNSRFLKTYYRRKADGLCVICESPNLSTQNFCADCAQKNRERSARSTANTL